VRVRGLTIHLEVWYASRYLAKYLGSKTSGVCLVFRVMVVMGLTADRIQIEGRAKQWRCVWGGTSRPMPIANAHVNVKTLRPAHAHAHTPGVEMDQ
jgi:hypothetical protein